MFDTCKDTNNIANGSPQDGFYRNKTAFFLAISDILRIFAVKLSKPAETLIHKRTTPMLQIRCKNNNITKSFPEGTSLLDVYQDFADELNMPYPVVSAKVNNTSQGLKFRLFQNRDVEFMDAREGSGHRC